MSKKNLLLLVMVMLVNIGVCLAAPVAENSTIAVALYIDTSGHYIPGIDMLNKALNEILRFKINALFLGSEVQSGDGVIQDLTRYGITNTSSATVDLLSPYAATAHVNYVMLFTIHPLDVSLDLKVFSASTNTYIIDQSLTRPADTETLSLVDTFSTMIGGQLTQLFKTLHPAQP